jgi:hypothetical protein
MLHNEIGAWHTPSNGNLTGDHMTPEQFRAIGARLYGKVGWRRQLAEALGFHRQTIYRYADGSYAVPLSVQLAMQALQDRQVREIADTTRAASPDPTSAGGGPVAAPPVATGQSQP